MRSRALPSLIPAAALALAACVAPAPPPRPAAPPPAAAVPRPPVDWRDLPEDKGAWRYRTTATGSEAAFGTSDGPVFVIRCDRPARQVLLIRPGTPAPALRLTTSYGATTYPAGLVDGMVAVRLAASDPGLDRLAFSRGRFTIEGGGTALVIPAWAEPGRVIEDCRQP